MLSHSFRSSARIFAVTCWQLSCLLSAAAEPPGYYASLNGLTGSELRQAMHDLIDSHNSLAYVTTRTALESVDEDPQNAANVLLVYSRRSEQKLLFVQNSPANPRYWNREHLWPNSLGIDNAEPAYSDLFNLRPADVDVNNRRANLNFDESVAADGNIITDPEAPLCTSDGNSWEVPAVMKGDIARSMFYMDVRYAGDIPGEPDLQLTDDLSSVSSTGTKFGRLTTLLLWHLSDPVDAAERLRNDRVFAQQQNRNPFVDRPWLVQEVFADPLVVKFEKRPAPASASDWQLRWWAALPSAVPKRSGNLLNWLTVAGIPREEGAWRLLPISLASLPSGTSQQFFRIDYRGPDVP